LLDCRGLGCFQLPPWLPAFVAEVATSAEQTAAGIFILLRTG
jgi:hypothetical protein